MKDILKEKMKMRSTSKYYSLPILINFLDNNLDNTIRTFGTLSLLKYAKIGRKSEQNTSLDTDDDKPAQIFAYN